MKTSLNWILGVFLAPFLTLAQEDSLSVVRAAYGAGTTQRDVTQLLQAQVRGNQLTIEVGNHTLGGDPIFGKAKTLYVRYRKSGSEFAVSAAEGETLRIPAANAKAIALVQETRPQPPANQQPPSVQTVQPGTPLGEITTLSGKKYLNATLTRIEPNGISITHDDGLAKVSFADLSEELRKKYGYDPTKAAEFTQTQQAAAAQRAAENKRQEKAQYIDKMMEEQGSYMMAATIRQMTDEGALVDATVTTKTVEATPWPGPVFVYGIPRVHADGETWNGKVYLVGNYKYTTTTGASKTVKAFACDKALAKKLLLKFAGELNGAK